eukprot:COSAG05_NODE_209_length_14039_cov_138.574892_9_plen_66_part_00
MQMAYFYWDFMYRCSHNLLIKLKFAQKSIATKPKIVDMIKAYTVLKKYLKIWLRGYNIIGYKNRS